MTLREQIDVGRNALMGVEGEEILKNTGSLL